MRDHNHQNIRPGLELIRLQPLPERVLNDRFFRRARFWAFLLMTLMVALSVYLFISTSELLELFQGRLAGIENSDAARIRHYNQQLESLQNRMSVFVADSVETKLKTLEKNVEAGTVGAQEIRTLEELRGEVKLLESYSAGEAGNLTDVSRLDHPRFQITPGTQSVVSSGEVLLEVSRMKNLLYLGIASCGLVGLLIGGYWWQTNHRHKRLANDMPARRLLIGRREAD